MGNCRLSNKKKGGRDVCKQKITERCVNISKIKNNYLFSDHSLCPKKKQKECQERGFKMQNSKCRVALKGIKKGEP